MATNMIIDNDSSSSKNFQPSRKGKKSWRKNIDVQDAETTMEFLANQERILGTRIGDSKNNQLFFVDNAGDENELKKHKGKKLRMDEILTPQSAVKPISNKIPKRKKPKTLSQFTIKKVEKIQKRLASSSHNATSTSVLSAIESKMPSPWDDSPTNLDISSENEYLVSVKPKKIKPPKQKKEPLPDIPAVKVSHPGASYNPDWEDHQELLRDTITRIEKKAEELKATQSQIPSKAALSKTIDLNEFIPHSDSEDECENSDQEESQVVSQPVVAKKKTKTQRNKEKNQMEKLKEQENHRQQKLLHKQVNMIHVLKKEIVEKEKQQEIKQRNVEARKIQNLKKTKKVGRLAFVDPLPEVQLSEELTGSLRQLKPEGNLFKDRFLSLQERNIIEVKGSSAPRRRKYSLKTYEKRSFKDFI